MLIADAQREVRTVYLGGSVGQLVSSLIWFLSASIASFVDPTTGFWALAIGGAAIFPLTQAILVLAGRKTALAQQNPLAHLAMQIAFTIPLVLPVAGAATLYRQGFFYPSCLIIVGAHYLPFVFLYGMKTFAVLAAVLVTAGFAIGMIAPDQVVLGGWVGGMILFAFSLVLYVAWKKGSTAELGHSS